MATPRTIGAYEIIREIGRGGMGIVYLAQDPVVDRRVALKMLPAELAMDDDARRRFAQEVEVFARLEHPHIVPTYAVDMSGSAPLLAMRYLPGGTLRERIAAGSLSRPDLWRAVRQIARALDYAHLQGLVHRDVKPTNILFDDAGNAYISDFGIAKIINATSMLTMANSVTGTPAYMSPEQFRREDIDGRSDQYSLAIVLFEALVGRPPFAGDTLKLMYQHVYELPPSLQSFGGGLPAGLSASLEHALAKQPEARYRSVEAFIDDAERQATTPAGKATPPPPLPSSAPSPLPSSAPVNREKAPSGRPETPVAAAPHQAAAPPAQATAPPKKKAAIGPIVVTGAGGQKEERRKMPRPLLAALILLPLLALGLFFLLRPTSQASQQATQAPAAVAEPTPPPTRAVTAEPEEPPSTMAPPAALSGESAGGMAVRLFSNGAETGTGWTLPNDGSPVVVLSGAEPMQLRYDDGSELYLAPDTEVALVQDDGRYRVQIGRGTVVFSTTGAEATISNRIGSWVRIAGPGAIAGVSSLSEPVIEFSAHCLAGDGCQLKGDLDNIPLPLRVGEAGLVGGSGRLELSGSADFNRFAALAPIVSKAAATPIDGITVMVNGVEVTPDWALAAGAPPAVVVNESDNMLIRFDDGSEVLLTPETTAALQLLDGEDGELLEIELRSGRLLVTMEGNSAGGGRPVTVINPFRAGARLQRGMMGVFGSLEPLRFEVDCLAGDGCDLAGDLDDTVLALQPGEAGLVGGSGRPELSGPAHFDLYALLSDRVPTPTATPKLTATPKPTHTPRAVATTVPAPVRPSRTAAPAMTATPGAATQAPPPTNVPATEAPSEPEPTPTPFQPTEPTPTPFQPPTAES